MISHHQFPLGSGKGSESQKNVTQASKIYKGYKLLTSSGEKEGNFVQCFMSSSDLQMI